MPFQLRVTRGASSGTTYSLVDLYSTSIGRSIDCSIQLDDLAVSRCHCRVLLDGGRATIEDAGSRWGTKVNGESVKQCELKPGDVIAVGETELRFEMIPSPDAITMAKPLRSSARITETMIPGRKGTEDLSGKKPQDNSGD